MSSSARISAIVALLASALVPACGGGGGGSGGGGTVGGGSKSLGMQPVNPEDKDRFERRFDSATIPAQAAWTAFLPPIGDQGAQGSCVGWSTAYYVKTAWEARNEGWSPATSDHQFSPAFLYNQINHGKDEGSLPADAMALITTKGAATLQTMPYDAKDFLGQPSVAAIAEASGFKNADYREYNTFDFNGLVSYLATTGPLVFGISVYDNFMRLSGAGDYVAVSGPNMGGHAIACVGYDLNRNGGSFLLANSWNTSWGAGGFAYVSKAVMTQIFLGAWSMVDGPNTGTGGAHDAPATFAANAWNAVVELQWSPLSWAKAYRLERRETAGNFQRIADFPGDTFLHQDLDVVANTTYVYRVAGVDSTGAVGTFAETTITTDSASGGASLTLVASDPDHGTSFPDRIALDWTTVAGSAIYAVFRSDTDDGFRTGNYDLIAIGANGSHLDDYVAAGAVYEYLVLAVDTTTLELIATSNTDHGGTSGSDGGADLGVLDAIGDTVVTRGAFADAAILIGNFTDVTSANQFIQMGVEYYLVDGSWGLLYYADAVAGTTPILAGTTDAPLAPFSSEDWFLKPIVPVYLITDLNTSWHFWYFHIEPLDATGALVPDVFPWDNDFWTEDLLLVQ